MMIEYFSKEKESGAESEAGDEYNQVKKQGGQGRDGEFMGEMNNGKKAKVAQIIEKDVNNNLQNLFNIVYR